MHRCCLGSCRCGRVPSPGAPGRGAPRPTREGPGPGWGPGPLGALCSPLRSRGSNFRAEDRAAAPGMPHAEPLLHDGPGPAASGATHHEEPRVPQHVCRTVTGRRQRGWPALGPCGRALGGSVPPARAVRGGRALPLASRLSEPQDGRARPPGVRAHTLRPGGRGSPPPLAAGL